METTEGTITDVAFKRSGLHPILVSFQNGYMLPDNATDFECRVKQNGRKRIVEMSSDSLIYRGSEAPFDTKICRTLLAVRNKNTNKVRLIEVDNVQLAPVLPGQESATQKSSSNEKSFSVLNKTFGSKRIKRRTELRERMTFEVKTMTNQLNEAVSGAEINQEDLAVQSADNLDSIVSCNRQADSVDQVYRLEDFISQYELDSMQEEAERILGNIESCTEKQYSKYFCNQLNKHSEDIQKIKLLLYSECLLEFYCLPFSEVRKKNVTACSFSEVINSKILDNFSVMVKSSRSRPITMLDKILCHIIVIGLLTNKFVLNVDPLIQSSNKIRAVRVHELCQALGLIPASKTDKTTVVLKLPLPSFRTSEVMKKKRK